MSAAAPLRRPVAARPQPTSVPTPRTATTARPRLVVVPTRRSSAGRLPFLILVGAVLVVGLVAVLLLHMLAAQDAFRANDLQQRLSILTDQEQQVASAVEADSSPQALRTRAAALGMVPATITGLHRLHDGRAVGQQTPVYVPPPAPTMTSKSTKASTKTTTTTTKQGTTTKSGASTKAGAKSTSATTAATKHTSGNTASKPAAGKGAAAGGGTTSPQHHKHHRATGQ